MTEFYQTYQNYVVAICIFLLAIVFGIAVLAASGALNNLIRKWIGMSVPAKIACLFSIAFVTLTGSTKGWVISFDGGIKQNPIQPSVVSNNLVSIHWTRDTSGGVYVPANAAVYIDYRILNDTNATWQTLAETTVGAWSWTGSVVNATNYSYNVWAYYIPPEPVHTNGVWIYKTLKDRQEKYPIPLRARIEVNGKAIATPKEKRKDEEQD